MIVYVAAPYTKGNVAQNIVKVIDCADELCKLGYTPFIPHLTHFWHIISPKPIDFWYQYGLIWLGFCDALLRLPGESVWADGEVQAAREKCLPVYYSVEELSKRNVVQRRP